MFPNFVLFLLLNASNQVLLLRRVNTPFCNGSYSLPGGKIELGETARNAVIREAKNSLVLDIKLDDIEFKHIMYRKCNEPEFFACIFKVKYSSEPVNCEPLRHDKMDWFDMDNLPEENIVSAHKYAIEQIKSNSVYSEHGFQS